VGIETYLIKPVPPQTLKETIEECSKKAARSVPGWKMIDKAELVEVVYTVFLGLAGALAIALMVTDADLLFVILLIVSIGIALMAAILLIRVVGNKLKAMSGAKWLWDERTTGHTRQVVSHSDGPNNILVLLLSHHRSNVGLCTFGRWLVSSRNDTNEWVDWNTPLPCFGSHAPWTQ
jgi:hypothetical protein